MEWLTDSEENMEVDIGFMPLMELRVTRSSVPAELDGVDIRSVHVNASSGKPDDTLSTIEWTEEVSEEETVRSLEVKLFPFKKVCMLCVAFNLWLSVRSFHPWLVS